jgi:hypothetical protein
LAWKLYVRYRRFIPCTSSTQRKRVRITVCERRKRLTYPNDIDKPSGEYGDMSEGPRRGYNPRETKSTTTGMYLRSETEELDRRGGSKERSKEVTIGSVIKVGTCIEVSTIC